MLSTRLHLLLIYSVIIGKVCSSCNCDRDATQCYYSLNCRGSSCEQIARDCVINDRFYEVVINTLCANIKDACKAIRWKVLLDVERLFVDGADSTKFIPVIQRVCEYQYAYDDYCKLVISKLHEKNKAERLLVEVCQGDAQSQKYCENLVELSVKYGIPHMEPIHRKNCLYDVHFEKKLCKAVANRDPNNELVKRAREVGETVKNSKRWSTAILRDYCVTDQTYCYLFYEEANNVNIDDVPLYDTCDVEKDLKTFCQTFLRNAFKKKVKFPGLHKRYCEGKRETNLCKEMVKLCSWEIREECKDVNIATCSNQYASIENCEKTMDLYCKDRYLCERLIEKTDKSLLQEVVAIKCTRMEDAICKMIVEVAIGKVNMVVIGVVYKPKCDAQICEKITRFCSKRTDGECFQANKDACERDAEKCLAPIKNFCKVEDSHECQEFYDATLKAAPKSLNALQRISYELCAIGTNGFSKHAQFCEKLAVLCTSQEYCSSITDNLAIHEALFLATKQADANLLKDAADKICKNHKTKAYCIRLFEIYNMAITLFARICTLATTSCATVSQIAAQTNRPDVEKTFRLECSEGWEKQICKELEIACNRNTAGSCKIVNEHYHMVPTIEEFQKKPDPLVLIKYCVEDNKFCGFFIRVINDENVLISLLKSVCLETPLGPNRNMCDQLLEKAKADKWINSFYNQTCNHKKSTKLEICQNTVSLCTKDNSDVCLDVNLQQCDSELSGSEKACSQMVDSHCTKGNKYCANFVKIKNQDLIEIIFTKKCISDDDQAKCKIIIQAITDAKNTVLIGKLYQTGECTSKSTGFCESLLNYCVSLKTAAVACLPTFKDHCVSVGRCLPLLEESCKSESDTCSKLVDIVAPDKIKELELASEICSNKNVSSSCTTILKELNNPSIVHSMYMERCISEEIRNRPFCEFLFEMCEESISNVQCNELVEKYYQKNAKGNVCEKKTSTCDIAFDAHCVSENKNKEKCKVIFAGIGEDKLISEFGSSCSDDKREDVCKQIFEKLRTNKAWIELIFDAHCTNALKSNECLKMKAFCEEFEMADSAQCRAIDAAYHPRIRIIAAVVMVFGVLLLIFNIVVFLRRRKKHLAQQKVANKKKVASQEACIL